jgi:dsDNA-specific endonuclease/ATPase MutS2
MLTVSRAGTGALAFMPVSLVSAGAPMTGRFAPGAPVQTPFGKGVVREVRNGGRVLVHVQGRSLVLNAGELSALDSERRSRGAARKRDAAPEPSSASPAGAGVRREIDLHGLTVEQALARAEEALNDALLADAPELRLIHGRSGGRIRDALHAWLPKMASVRFRVDPRNPGVTIVLL